MPKCIHDGRALRSPLLVASPEVLTIVADAGLHEPVRLDLVSALEADAMLFLRYRVRHER